MIPADKIEHLALLAARIKNSPLLQQKLIQAERKNNWFVPQFVQYALNAITGDMLNPSKLREWLTAYEVKPVNKTIGLVFAGNVPLVGLHDFLCCYITGASMKIKLSSKDDELFLWLLDELKSIDTNLGSKVELVDKLKDFNAVIATGSDNTNRYFEYYFRNHPRILRKNRNSVAILTGNESPGQLQQLADDIFLYFGFGCRNVSKLYVPVGYDFNQLFPQFDNYKWLHHQNKYMHNYDYNRTILLLNKTPHFANEFVMLTEKQDIASPISLVNYEYWHDKEVLNTQLKLSAEKIQCVVSGNPADWKLSSSVKFGQSQHPELWDYADNVDTLQFLLGL